MELFCQNNHFTVLTRNDITRMGNARQADSSNDHILVKQDLPFIREISRLVTMIKPGFDHKFYYLDINLSEIQSLEANIPMRRWNQKLLKNENCVNKIQIMAETKLIPYFNNIQLGENNDVQATYNEFTSILDQIFDKNLSNELQAPFLHLNLTTIHGLVYYKNFLDNIQSREFTGNVSKWKKKRNKLFTPNAISESPNDAINQFFTRKFRNLHPGYVESTHTEMDTIEEDELMDVFRHKLSNKSPGMDEYSKQIIKVLPPVAFNIIRYLFNLINSTNDIPSQWKIHKSILSYKRNSAMDLANYRTLTMQSIFRKFYSYFITKQFNAFGEFIDPCQIGFVAGKDPYFGILALDFLLSKKKLESIGENGIQQVFLDIKSAYDTVPCHKLWLYLERKGFKTKLLQNLFDGNSTTIFKNGTPACTVNLELGLAQGDVLSTYLFNIFISTFLARLRHLKYSRIQGYLYALIVYADDICLICK
eukprot:NODE_422_length_7706_cov_0.257229.p1 type:complete len:478 gc:universal NODE_422_length_7706_cov_0.257229:2261-3694(+)